MKYSRLKLLIVFWVLPLGCYAQEGNNNNDNDDSWYDDTQARLTEAVKIWKYEWRRVIPASITNYSELKAAIETLRPIDEQSLTASSLSQRDLNKALLLACSVGNTLAMGALLQAGADANARDLFRLTPLYSAISQNDLNRVKVLLEAGVDISACDDYGRRPLHWAAKVGSLVIVRALLEAGADVNALSNAAQAPLHCAVRAGSLAVARLLVLEAGVDVNARNYRGETPLHGAVVASLNSLAVVVFLIEYGADVHAKDNAGRTPLDLAKQAGDPSVVAFLSHSAPVVRNNNNNNDNDAIVIEDSFNEGRESTDLVAEFSRSFGMHIKRSDF
jgi:ankyrin repeat protein